MLALFGAVVLGILLKDHGLLALGGVLGAYAIFTFLFFFFSDRFKDMIDKVILPVCYPNLMIFLGLLPLLFVLSFWNSGRSGKRAEERREAYSLIYEAGEKECVVLGIVRSKDIRKDQIALTLEKCRVKGYYENIERSGGGCRVFLSEGEVPECGDEVKVYGAFYFINDPMNPGEYNTVPKSHSENVYARIYGKKIFVEKRKKTALDLAREGLARLRISFEESISETFDDKDGGLLIAMITGNRDFEEEEVVNLYRRAGISHILAISGLHVSLLCLGLWRLLKKLTVGKWTRSFLTLGLLGFIILFTGGSVSTLRAGGMCVIFLLGRLLRRHYDLLSALFMTASLILIFRPWELNDPSFILSVSAISAVHFAREIQAGPFFGFVLTVFMLPVTALYFYEIPTYAFISNLIVIPLTGFMLIFGILSGSFGIFCPLLGKTFGGGAFLLLRLFEAVSGFVSGLPFSFLLTGTPRVSEMVLFFCLMFVTLKIAEKLREKNESGNKAGRRTGKGPGVGKAAGIGKDTYNGKMKEELKGFRYLGTWWLPALILSLLLVGVHFLPKGAKLTFLYVGQGDCSVFVSGKKDTVLFDCGSTSNAGVGKRVLSPFLKSSGIMLLDTVTVSHTDEDHINGITEILENMRVYRNDADYRMRYDGNIGIKTLVMPEVRSRGENYLKLLKLAGEKNVRVIFLDAGDELELRDSSCRLLCLSPYEAETSENETSLVFRLDTPEFTAFMMGDAGAEAEKKIADDIWEIAGKRMTDGMGEKEGKRITDGMGEKEGKRMTDGMGEKEGKRITDGMGEKEGEGMTDVIQELAGRFGFQKKDPSKKVVLKVGHHGSRTATSEAFVEMIRPSYAVISCGRGNTYGHPHREVLDILEAAGVVIHRTDREGAVVIGK